MIINRKNHMAGDDEIPEIIEGSDEEPLPKTVASGISGNVTPPRNLPGSAWLKSKRVQVIT